MCIILPWIGYSLDTPINISPHYPLDGQGWGLIGDLTAFDLKNIGPRGGAFDFGHGNATVLYRSNPLFIPMVKVGI